ncbi:MAG: hypothetical protein B9J98_03270 [Candidatus Terraquivivens tikiterensis]|uniref:DUF2116 family Zn-ribbon domain-containing protein n=1 Tax=Candidatus Terraquivivens tikiterensis TaxID=1980982 RepID=A0A2R7Y7U1_9ARCH|nr:MAG: hypothetical protein B9J98_03270 [Candidatus Terraquivivens tikiterensis]
MGQQKKEKPKIVDHRHCIVCGRAIPPDEQVCSPDCREKLELSKEKEQEDDVNNLRRYGSRYINLLSA